MGMIFYDKKYDEIFEAICKFFGVEKCIVCGLKDVVSESPGVYMFMHGLGMTFIPYYVGFAGNLKNRVRGHDEHEPCSNILFIETADETTAARIETFFAAAFYETLKNKIKLLKGVRPCRT